jgi:hypothetical protein
LTLLKQSLERLEVIRELSLLTASLTRGRTEAGRDGLLVVGGGVLTRLIRKCESLVEEKLDHGVAHASTTLVRIGSGEKLDTQIPVKAEGAGEQVRLDTRRELAQLGVKLGREELASRRHEINIVQIGRGHGQRVGNHRNGKRRQDGENGGQRTWEVDAGLRCQHG